MPSSLIQHQHQHQQRMPTWRHSLTDCFQVKCHGLGIGIAQHEANCRITLRAYGAKDIRRFRLLLPHDTGPCSLRAQRRVCVPHCPMRISSWNQIDLVKLNTSGKNGFYLLGKFF